MRPIPFSLCALLSTATIAFAQAPASPASSASPAAAAYSPSFAKGSRVFELRTYYANPGKLEALNTRFREHTNTLFQKHGMTLVAYWMPVTPPAEGTGGTLIYVLAYPTLEAREAAWKAFGSDPDWVSARDASERDGKLLAKIDSVLMKATDYSPMK
jgi:hypothetical protein